MRIISGKFRGKSINFLKSVITRPLKDSVKENIFNIITHSNLINVNLKNANVLDLYSGIGSFGIECLSRGAKTITFVEKNTEIIKVLKKNLSILSLDNHSTIIKDEISNFLKIENSKKYDLIFLDPPFSDNLYLDDLRLIKKKGLHKSNHLIIIHRERKKYENLNKVLAPLIVKEYGRSKIIFGQLLS